MGAEIIKKLLVLLLTALHENISKNSVEKLRNYCPLFKILKIETLQEVLCSTSLSIEQREKRC